MPVATELLGEDCVATWHFVVAEPPDKNSLYYSGWVLQTHVRIWRGIARLWFLQQLDGARPPPSALPFSIHVVYHRPVGEAGDADHHLSNILDTFSDFLYADDAQCFDARETILEDLAEDEQPYADVLVYFYSAECGVRCVDDNHSHRDVPVLIAADLSP